MERRQVDTTKLQVFLFSVVFILSIWAPATTGSTLGPGSIRAVVRILLFVLIFLIIFALYLKKIISIDALQISIAITPIINFLYHKFYVYNISNASLSVTLLCALYAITDANVKRKIYVVIKNILILMSVIGIICYMTYILHLGLPYTINDFYVNNEGLIMGGYEKYVNYRICFLYITAAQVRLCGLFNEPGWFGGFLAIILCCEDLNLKKISNVFMLVAGILTFSIAFFTMLMIYYVLTNIKYWKKWVWIVVLFILVFFVLPNSRTGIPYIDTLISRINAIFNNKTFGRTSNQVTEELIRILKNGDIVFGKGTGFSSSIKHAGLSIILYLLDYGIVGVTLLFLPFFFFNIKKFWKNKKIVFFLICIAAYVYQRPWLFEASNFILFESVVFYLNDNKYIQGENYENQTN